MVKIVLIQGSLNPQSRTAIVCDAMAKALTERGIEVDLIDLRTLQMQFCDGRPLEQYNKDMRQAHARMQSANAFVIGMPVYNYTISGPLKNFLEITCDALNYKVSGTICNSGGVRSFLASANLMVSLSYEVWALMVQPIVHTSIPDFKDGKIINETVFRKIDELCHSILNTHCASGSTDPSKIARS